MELSFLDRGAELQRLRRAFDSRTPEFVCLYGRRRCGKSRLLLKALEGRAAVYCVAVEREAPLQRAALAREIERLLPGFGRVTYPSWDDLLDRWYREARAGSVLALDEFPFLVMSSPELPGLLQKHVDASRRKGPHLAICGSSQRMMFGLVLDGSAPLYGRAREIIKVAPLALPYVQDAFGSDDPVKAVEAYAVWGGVPRYWELALDLGSLQDAIRDLVLSPLGILHQEPQRLLLDELRDTQQASSLLALVGQGANRLSEIAGRIQRPATSLTRPLSWLIDMGLLRREVPFGVSPRDAKRSIYRIDDPFLSFWYRYVDPNSSALASGRVEQTLAQMRVDWDAFLGAAWEVIARQSTAVLRTHGQQWHPAQRWWGRNAQGEQAEFDIVAQSAQRPDTLLVGEVKLTIRNVAEGKSLLAGLEQRARLCPFAQGKRILLALWVLRKVNGPDTENVLGPGQVLSAFREDEESRR